MEAVISSLDKCDPEAGERARHRYACFDFVGENEQEYGYAVEYGMASDCERQCVQQLTELLTKQTDYAAIKASVCEDEHFYAVMNANVVRDAEQYYRAIFRRHDERCVCLA